MRTLTQILRKRSKRLERKKRLHKSLNELPADIRRRISLRYAWPGGYPQYLLLSDNATLCMGCCEKRIDRIIEDYREFMRDGCKGQFIPLCVEINYEDNDLYCDECSQKIESAYAD